jgi:hypothetical protein
MVVESQLTRRAAILAKVETTYAVDAEPTPAENGVLINNGVEITPQADRVDRNIVRDTFSPAGSAVGAKSVDLAVQVEARGGGLSGDGKPLPPDYAPILLACGMAQSNVVRLGINAAGAWKAGEEIVGGTSAAHGVLEYIERDKMLVIGQVTGTFAEGETITGNASAATATVASVTPALMYTPNTATPSTQKSDSIYYHKDGILHRGLGIRGTFSMDAQVGKTPVIDFKLSGLWADPVDADMSAPALTSLAGAQFLNADMMIGGYKPVFTSLKLDIGNKIERRQDANSVEGIVGLLITSRSPSGSLDPEVDKLAGFNPWTAWKDSNARARINGYIGSTPGNRLAIHIGAAQYTDLKYGDRIGLATYQLGFLPTQERLGDDDTRFLIF